MNLDPMLTFSHDQNDYSNYDNRPIRPMDQEALNEALARLPILVDQNESINSLDPLTNFKNRRQPVLAYSTRRKNQSGSVPVNQSLLSINSTLETPLSNKRKVANGNTPIAIPSAKKLLKQIDHQQELNQLKEEKQLLEEMKTNLQVECSLLKKTYEEELENLKQDHQRQMDQLTTAHQMQYDQMKITLDNYEQLVNQKNLEMANLRDDHALLLLEKETLNKMLSEYQSLQEQLNHNLNEKETIIKNLREELTQLKTMSQPKPINTRSNVAHTRTPLKESTVDRPRMANTANLLAKEPLRPKANVKSTVTTESMRDDPTKTPLIPIHSNVNNLKRPSSSVSTVKSSVNKAKVKPIAVPHGKIKATSSVDKPTRLGPKLAV